MKLMFSIVVVIIHNTVNLYVWECKMPSNFCVLEDTSSRFSLWQNCMKYISAVWPTLLLCFVQYVHVRMDV
jgi:hypothetical protein